MLKVPELSLKAYTHGPEVQRARFVEELFAGLTEYGFVILKDHPIEITLLRKAYQLSTQLFELTEETKLRYHEVGAGGQRGYTPFGKEHAKSSQFPDLKEFWHVGRDLARDHRLYNFFAKNVWPAELPDFEPTFKQMFKALDKSGRIMLEALTGPLEVSKTYFSDMTEAGSSILRLLHYPPIAEGVDQNCVRAAAHEDINLITLLVSASSSGLELLCRNGQWLAVDAAPDTIIVDSGDMLARITNDRIPATTHRVVNPQGPNVSRYSMPFFMHPNPDAVLTCIPSCQGEAVKYPDILANEFLFQRLNEIGLTK